MRGLFVTGTGTGTGKTLVSAALLAAMRAAGEPAHAYKPVMTGLDEPPVAWPHDHDLLGLAAGGIDPLEVAPLRFGPAVSPHLAAELAGESIDPAALAARARRHGDHVVVVEGAGGLLVPLTDGYTMRDLAAELELPLVIAAPPGLGTINHTLLTIESARSAGLDVRAVVLTPWPSAPTAMEVSNRETIERLGQAEVHDLGYVAPPSPADPARVGADLAQAGSRLPWRKWLEPRG